MGGKFYSEEVAPAQSGDQFALLPIIEKRTRSRFRFMVHPDAWTWRADLKCYVPDLCRMVISGGVHGTAILPNGIEDDSLCRQNWGKKGWRIIELGDPRYPSAGQYLRRWKTVGNGWAHSASWEHPNMAGGAVIWHVDEPARDEFLRTIVATGTVPPMDVDRKRQFLAVAENRLRRYQERDPSTVPHAGLIRTRAQSAEALVLELRAELADAVAGKDRTRIWAGVDQEPAPTRTRKARPVSEVGEDHG